jgi:hypothetical protein
MLYLLPLLPREGANIRHIPTDPPTILGKQTGKANIQVSDTNKYTIQGIRVLPTDGCNVSVSEIDYDTTSGSYVNVKILNLDETNAVVNIQVVEISKFPPGGPGPPPL